jgi:hypothetical protein
MTYFSADNKLKTGKLFVQNLLRGLVEINYEKFESVESNFVDKIVEWIYDFIIKGRSYEAIKG